MRERWLYAVGRVVSKRQGDRARWRDRGVMREARANFGELMNQPRGDFRHALHASEGLSQREAELSQKSITEAAQGGTGRGRQDGSRAVALSHSSLRGSGHSVKTVSGSSGTSRPGTALSSRELCDITEGGRRPRSFSQVQGRTSHAALTTSPSRPPGNPHLRRPGGPNHRPPRLRRRRPGHGGRFPGHGGCRPRRRRRRLRRHPCREARTAGEIERGLDGLPKMSRATASSSLDRSAKPFLRVCNLADPTPPLRPSGVSRPPRSSCPEGAPVGKGPTALAQPPRRCRC